MKSRSTVGKNIFVCLVSLFFFSLEMSFERLDILVLRDSLAESSKDANEWILSHCYYCKNCRACATNSTLQKELKRNSLKDKNKHV